MDWLQGKPVGLLTVSVELSEKIEDPVILIVDYTNKESPTVVYSGRGYSSFSATFKIPRIPEKVIKEMTPNGLQEKTVFKQRTYVVIVSGKGKWDAELFRIIPDKPITKVTIRATLQDTSSLPKSKFQLTTVYDHQYIGTDDAYVKVGKVYSIPGIKVAWHIPLHGTVGVDSFKKSDMTGGKWIKLGVEYPDSRVDRQVAVSNGAAKLITAHVYYRCDKYTTCGNIWCNTQYIMMPTNITGIYSSSTSNPLGGTHPNSPYVEYVTQGDEPDNKFKVDAGYSEDGGEYLLTPSISLSFGVGPVSVSFSGDISSYRSSGSKTGPYFDVWILDWRNNRLYYWWMKGSLNRGYSAATYEVGFSWS